MATEVPGFSHSYVAAADLSAKQFFPMIMSEGQVTVPAGQGVWTCGVLQNKPASGGIATVMHSGITKAVAGAAIDVSTSRFLTSATDGVETAASGDYVIGWALTDAAEGDIIEMVLCPTAVPLA